MDMLAPRETGSRRTAGKALAAILVLSFCGGLTQIAAAHSPAAGAPAKAPYVPPYHTRAPRGPLPQVLPWFEFAGNACAENAYYLAAQIRPVLYQQPCYCPCGKELGHTCLLDCFTRPDKHAAICATCLQEAIFAYQQVVRGVNARAIRKKIIKGEWKKIDLAKYSQPPSR